MPPTDCFGDSDACSASLSCVPEQHRGLLLPTTRSPLHHGTDPDLSAPTPLPSGVAVTGLDLSPVTAGSCGLMSKRKQRGSPARGGGGGGGGGGGLMSSVPSRLSRSFPREARAESQAKRVATLIPPEESPQKQHQHQQARPAMHSSPAAAKARAAAAAAAAAAKTTAAATRTTAAATTTSSSREEPSSSSSSSYSMPDSSTMPSSGATAGAGAAFAEASLRGAFTKEEVVEPTFRGGGGAFLVGRLGSASRGGGDQHDCHRAPDEGEAPPGLMPLGSGSRPAYGALSPSSLSPAFTRAAASGAIGDSINSTAAAGMVQRHCCSPPSSPSRSPPPPSGGAATAVSPAPDANGSSCVAVSGANSGVASGGSAAGVAATQESKQAALKAMMLKAKMASDNIRLLLHAQRCDGTGCKEPGCESARQLVKHMRSCESTGELKPGCKQKCVQAKKMLQHYQECSRKRALGGRYCLVCSLVARSATTTNNDNSNNASSSGTPPVNRRLPLRHLVPGSGLPARQGPCGLQQNTSRGVGGLPSPVAITRLRKGSARPGQLKDGVFFRPLPKARRGSWGGYDRCQYWRRTRFDSIPEELAEEDGDGDDDDEDHALDQESASSGGSKPSDDSGRSKTLVSSHSL